VLVRYIFTKRERERGREESRPRRHIIIIKETVGFGVSVKLE